MINNDYELNLDDERHRASLLFKKQIRVHVTKKDGIFHNGLIIELSKDFFVIDDLIKGEQLVLFTDLRKSIEIYNDIKEVGDGTRTN